MKSNLLRRERFAEEDFKRHETTTRHAQTAFNLEHERGKHNLEELERKPVHGLGVYRRK